MSIIKDKLEFEPSKETKFLWLSTRKEPYFAGDLKLPGLFQTHNYSTDVARVIFAVAIEVGAACMIVGGALQKSNEKLFIAVAISVVFIIMDYMGMILHHSPVARRLQESNLVILAKDAATRQAHINSSKKFSSRRFWGTVLIVFSAIIKIVSAIGYLAQAGAIATVVLTIMFILVMYVHLYHTGYAYSEWKFRKKLLQEHKKWAEQAIVIRNNGSDADDNSLNAKARTLSFKISFELAKVTKGLDLQINGHSLKLLSANNNEYTYELHVKGLLTDDDVTHLCMGQLPHQKTELAKACLEIQLKDQLNN